VIDEILLNANYVEQGRNFPDVDCYGIVLYVRGVLGLPELPELNSAKKILGSIDEFGIDQASSMSICKPKEGSVAACYDSLGSMTHTGVVINRKGLYVVECNPKRNASCIPISRFIRRFHRVEFYE
jgi:hypothetical protein